MALLVVSTAMYPVTPPYASELIWISESISYGRCAKNYSLLELMNRGGTGSLHQRAIPTIAGNLIARGVKVVAAV